MRPAVRAHQSAPSRRRVRAAYIERVDALSFFGLTRAGDGNTWELPVVPQLCSGLGALFGGCGLGASIEALEQSTGRPLVWATAQYLSYARPPSVVELDDHRGRAGPSHRPRRACRRARRRRGDLHGHRRARDRASPAGRASGRVRPDVPAPAAVAAASHARPPRRARSATASRCASPTPARSRSSTACPATGAARCGYACPTLEMSAAAARDRRRLRAVRHRPGAGPSRAGGNSLDNTLRVVRAHPTEWVLADIRVHAVARRVRPRRSCTSGPRTAHCSAPRASRRSCARTASTARRHPSERSPALRHHRPVRRRPAARAPGRGSRSSRRSATPTCGRPRPAAPTRSRRSRWRPRGRRRCASAPRSSPRTRAARRRSPQTVASDGAGRAGPLRARHRHVVERHRRELERRSRSRSRTSASATRSGSCGRRSPARRSPRSTTRSR